MPKSVLDLIERLVRLQDRTRAGVETELGLKLRNDDESSTRFFNVLKGATLPSDSFMRSVEVRLPRPDATSAKGPLIHVDVQGARGTAALNAHQLIAKLGQPAGMDVPSPQAAGQTGAVNYLYRLKDGGRVTVAIGPPPDEAVISVAVDWTE